MAGLIFDKAQIEQTIDAVVARTMRMDMTWDWPCGVAYYGHLRGLRGHRQAGVPQTRAGPCGRIHRAGPARVDRQHLLDGTLPHHAV